MLSHQLVAAGKIYWNNHSYNELDGSIGVGMGYRNVNTMVQFIPFYEKSYYGGGQTSDDGLQSYSDTIGIKMETELQLSPRWRLYSDLTLGKNEYKEKNYLDGYRYSLNETLIYFPSLRQYISAGLGYSMLRTKEKDSFLIRPPSGPDGCMNGMGEYQRFYRPLMAIKPTWTGISGE